jgi:hypothetical protein
VSDKATTCEACSAAFIQTGRGRPRRFCLACSPRDPIAATRAWRERNGINEKARAARYAARPIRSCRQCGDAFKAVGKQVYCSPRCSKKAENVIYRDRRRLAAKGKSDA